MRFEIDQEFRNMTSYFHPKKILIVEDDPQWQKIISQTIPKLDSANELRCVSSAKHAEQLLYYSQPSDLIIADHYLEGDKTGLDHWKNCRSFHRGTPFVVVSGLKEATFKDLLQDESQIPYFLEKPFNIDKFSALLAKIFRGRFGGLALKKDIINQLKTYSAVVLSAATIVVASFENIGEEVKELRTPAAISQHVLPVQEPAKLESSHKFNVHEVVSPEVKQTIARIVASANEMVK